METFTLQCGCRATPATTLGVNSKPTILWKCNYHYWQDSDYDKPGNAGHIYGHRAVFDTTSSKPAHTMKKTTKFKPFNKK